MAAMKPNLDELAVGAKSGLPWSAYDCTRIRLRQSKTGGPRLNPSRSSIESCT
jgi:hypothetical protein